ncbi:efflux transporter outer membrane subunit [Pelistega suis]|uniref:TolC family protein n=1 Tax=Pelistega suis TaxID=1631957 RepID=A0A849NZP3_9BURK|nr:TolC family protein [Pelistega suis]NOL50999.1 TolC family protein [Pelistega suis]
MKKFLFSILMTSILTACANTTIPVESSVNLPIQFEKNKNAMGSEDIRQWWSFWQDSQLTQLIEEALRYNKDIALAQTHLAEARSTAQLATADKGPTIGVGANIGAARTRANDLPLIGDSYNTFSAGGVGVSASWEPDFFGKKQSDADAAMYAALSKEEQLYATQLAIVAQLAQSYFQFNTLWQYHAILSQNLTVLNKLHRYLQGRFNAGHVTRYEVEQIQSNILSLQAQQSDLITQADSLARQIAVLSGKNPQNLASILHPNLKVLQYAPPAPTGQLPGTVMERRPDIRAYALGIKARSAQLASAKADLLPRFDIQFLGQGGRLSLSSDLSSVSGLASIVSAGVQLPIFTNGRIQANIDAANARLKASIIEYDQALLKALAEVESHYQLNDGLAQKVRLLEKTISQQQQQAQNADKLFKHGHKTLDEVLKAQLDSLTTQRELTQARLQRHENMISLYKALGGGW